MQQQQPGTVTHSRISFLLISRLLTRPRVVSRYSFRTFAWPEVGVATPKFSAALHVPVAEPPFLNFWIRHWRSKNMSQYAQYRWVDTTCLIIQFTYLAPTLLSLHSNVLKTWVHVGWRGLGTQSVAERWAAWICSTSQQLYSTTV